MKRWSVMVIWDVFVMKVLSTIWTCCPRRRKRSRPRSSSTPRKTRRSVKFSSITMPRPSKSPISTHPILSKSSFTVSDPVAIASGQEKWGCPFWQWWVAIIFYAPDDNNINNMKIEEEGSSIDLFLLESHRTTDYWPNFMLSIRTIIPTIRRRTAQNSFLLRFLALASIRDKDTGNNLGCRFSFLACPGTKNMLHCSVSVIERQHYGCFSISVISLKSEELSDPVFFSLLQHHPPFNSEFARRTNETFF